MSRKVDYCPNCGIDINSRGHALVILNGERYSITCGGETFYYRELRDDEWICPATGHVVVSD